MTVHDSRAVPLRKLQKVAIRATKHGSEAQVTPETVLIGLIGLRENLQGTPIFNGKNHGFRFKFSLKPIQWCSDLFLMGPSSWGRLGVTIFPGRDLGLEGSWRHGDFFWRVTGTTNEPWWSIVDIVPEPDFIYIYIQYIYIHWYTHISIYIYIHIYILCIYIYYRGYSILGFIMVCPTMEKPWCTIYGQPGVRQRPALSELVASDRPIAPAPSSAVEACEFQHEPNTI